MAAVWVLIRLILVQSLPEGPVPYRAWIAGAFVLVYAILATVMFRRITGGEVRGRSIIFSNEIKIENNFLIFEIVDERKNPLFGISVFAEIFHVSGKCFRIPIQSPRSIPVPTEVRVPMSDIFSNCGDFCEICGKSNFYSKSKHLKFHHKIESEKFLETFESMMEKLKNIQIKIQIDGTDEISGRPGTAQKIYALSDILLPPHSSTRPPGRNDDDTTVASTRIPAIDEGTSPISFISSIIEIDFQE